MPLPGGTTFSDISMPADPRRFRRNSLPLAGLGTSGDSRRNSVHASFGPAWTQVKLVPRTVFSFSIVLLLSGWFHRETCSEHGKAALGLLLRYLVLNHIPMFGQHAVCDAHDI